MTLPPTLYCVSHKPVELPAIPGLRILQTGDKSPVFSDVLDSTGDNIASRNPFYSELTGFYQVWKNRPAPVVGFCHYRRFLLPPSSAAWLKQATLGRHEAGERVGAGAFADHLTALGDAYCTGLFDLLGSADIVLPRSLPLPAGSFMRQYGSVHPIAPLLRATALVAETDNAVGAELNRFLNFARQAHWNNLFVTRWDVFADYCHFLFPLLRRLEKEVTIPESPYQRRVFAFLSERLFNFWVWHNGLSIREVDWCLIDEQLATVEDHHWQRQ